VIATQPLRAILDPLCQQVELPLDVTLYPLGFPLHIATNSTDVIASARRVWDYFPQRFRVDPVRLRIMIAEGTESAQLPVYRAQGHLFSIVGSRENFAACNLSQAFGSGWFTSSSAADHDAFAFFFLEALVYTCLTHLHLTAVHAACVALGGRGALLCGGSGAGKSCLAYACARDGFTFVSDDSTALLRRSQGRRVIGKPGCIRLRQSAVEILPEFDGALPRRLANGKDTIEIRTAELPSLRTDFECRADFIVFLNRAGTGPTNLRPVPRDEARRRLEEQIPVLENSSYTEQITSLERLLECECLELEYRDLGAAVTPLKQLLSRGG
jgi:hypothetical protein